MSQPAAKQAPLSLDPSLTPKAWREAFAASGRLHVPGFLTADSASRLHAALTIDTPWSGVVGVGTRLWNLPLDGPGALSAADDAALDRQVAEETRAGFGFRFDNFRVSDEIEAGRREGRLLEAAYDLINGEAFLGFVRDLTGDDRPEYCDCQATRYRPGHFLTEHDDHADGKNRLYAYVLNLTPRWRSDWGGLLLFLDGDGHVAEGYTPSFNALNIFRVPQKHAVSYVTPHAAGPRLSLTGWIRTRG
ncbi:2OG-Fe(II) oxygenase family protein [Caulobacter sp. CCNWLY153]|uniref:2OG-Fe(II) oxygenase n=1 Tax=unclassified Caulobacter TaxID=2648921 RepID=UPI002FF16BDB